MAEIDRAKQILEEVVDLPAQERGSRVRALCAGDIALEALVQALLANYAGEGDTASASSAPAPLPHAYPERVGPYRILKKIGQGGMGEVFAAIRDDQTVSRRVAIKLVRLGLDAEGLRRFELERQVLTVLNHPNIARLFDAGVTPEGRPYMVMEFVEGLPLDEYCNSNKLHVSQRLDLFRKVCGAVSYAHASLVVHRDLKPTNILVTPQGDVKLLDFGIAKLINPDWLLVPLYTGPEMTLMTPEYASPEQARREPITIASDVYSLGIILYELLTGSRPYEFKTRLQEEIRRVICEEPPERPSTRIARSDSVRSHQGDRVRTIDLRSRADERAVSPDNYRRLLGGELETLVLHALKKEPLRRYRSVDEFSQDVQHWLSNEPLVAVGDSPSYRASKFIRRNRGKVVAVILTLAFLIAGLVSTSILLRRANRAESRLGAERDLLVRLLSSMMNDVIPEANSLAGSAQLKQTISDLTRKCAEELSAQSDSNPQLRHLRRAAATQYAVSLGGLGESAGAQYPAAARIMDSVLEELRRLHKGDPNDASVRDELAFTLLTAGDVQRGFDKTEESLHLYREALSIFRLSPASAREAAVTASAIAELLQRKSSGAEESRKLCEYSLATRLELKDDSDIASGHARLAEWHLEVDQDFHAASREAEAAFAIRQRLLADSPSDAWRQRDCMNALALCAVARRGLRDYVPALDACRRAHDIASSLLSSSCDKHEPDAPRNEIRIRKELLRTRLESREAELLRPAEQLSSDCRAALHEFPADPSLLEYEPEIIELVGDAAAAAGVEKAANSAWTEALDKQRALLAHEHNDDIVLARCIARLTAKLRPGDPRSTP